MPMVSGAAGSGLLEFLIDMHHITVVIEPAGNDDLLPRHRRARGLVRSVVAAKGEVAAVEEFEAKVRPFCSLSGATGIWTNPSRTNRSRSGEAWRTSRQDGTGQRDRREAQVDDGSIDLEIWGFPWGFRNTGEMGVIGRRKRVKVCGGCDRRKRVFRPRPNFDTRPVQHPAG